MNCIFLIIYLLYILNYELIKNKNPQKPIINLGCYSPESTHLNQLSKSWQEVSFYSRLLILGMHGIGWTS